MSFQILELHSCISRLSNENHMEVDMQFNDDQLSYLEKLNQALTNLSKELGPKAEKARR